MKIDTLNIKKMTKAKIAYDQFKKEGEDMKKKMRFLTFVVLAVVLLAGGTISADALTDGAVSNAAKEAVANILKIKVDGKDYNAHCENGGNGTVKCSLDSSVLDDGEFDIEVSEDYLDSVEVEVQGNDAMVTIK